jgi:hypothetical protein
LEEAALKDLINFFFLKKRLDTFTSFPQNIFFSVLPKSTCNHYTQFDMHYLSDGILER